MGTSIAVLSIWLILALPGYLWIRRLSEDTGGWLGTLSLSYVYSFALFTPFSLACYFFNLSISVFASGIGALIATSAVVLMRHAIWKRLSWHVTFIGVLGMTVMLVDLVLAVRTGGRLSGDALYHLARVRMILEHGANNWEPFYFPHQFSQVYHSNLYHALLAAIAKALRVDILDVWRDTLLWAKIITASGIYYLSWSVFRNRVSPWLSVVLYVMWWGHENFQLVPNKIAPVWLLAMAIAMSVRCIRDQRCRDVAALACVCLILPQFHLMYSFFCFLLLTPVFLLVVLLHRWRTKRWSLVLSLAIGTLLFSAPFLVISRYSAAVSQPGDTSSAHSQKKPASKIATPRQPRTKKSSSVPWFINVGNGDLMFNPARYLTPYTWMGWLFPFFVLGLATPHRRSVFIVMAVMLSACLVMFVPAICTMLLEITGLRAWVIRRYAFVHVIGFIGVAPGVITSLLGKWSERWSMTFGLVIICIVLGLHRGAWPETNSHVSWKDYVGRARLPHAARSSAMLLLKSKRDFLAHHIPPGQTVLTSKSLAPELVMLHDVYVLASAHSSLKSTQRSRDLRILWNRNAPWDQRHPILQKYGIEHVVLRRRQDTKQYARYRKHSKNKVDGHGITVMSLVIGKYSKLSDRQTPVEGGDSFGKSGSS